jgi:hypothetical protein
VRTTRDFRTPADPQDFETLHDKAARPPRDFRVTKDAGNTLVILEFQDYSSVSERDSTVEYRAYYVPSSAATLAEIGTLARRRAALAVGRLAGSVPASGKGEWVKVSTPDFAGQTGFYLAVGVNRRGVESEPTLAYRSPY